VRESRVRRRGKASSLHLRNVAVSLYRVENSSKRSKGAKEVNAI